MRLVCIIKPLNLLVLTCVLQSCALVFGTGPHAKIPVQPDATVIDLSTNKELRVNRDSPHSQFVRVPSGKRYALRIEQDSQILYALVEPVRDYNTLFNVVFLGLGVIPDHLSKSFYKYPISGTAQATAYNGSDRSGYEDSLRSHATWLTPTSLIDDRDSMVLVPFFTGGFDFLLYRDADPTERTGFGIGLQISPVLMPFAEAGVSHRGSLSNARPWYAIGVQIQEPTSGLCAGLRLGLSAANPNRQFGSPAAFIVGSGGIYGQWGRFELRYRHNLSWHILPEDPPVSRGYIGFQYSFHVYL